jgi:tetratricopeptide (TPR) repeat protein
MATPRFIFFAILDSIFRARRTLSPAGLWMVEGHVMRTLLTVAVFVSVAALAGAQDRLADQLNKSIVLEEAGGNPERAIQAYKAIVAQFDEDRKVAATALYRLAECYRKAGMRTEAQAAYQRIVREFGDEAALAEPSRRQLMDAFGLSDSRTMRESEALLKAQRDLTAAREELERSRTSELRSASELATISERTTRPMSVEEARLELAILERRMADTKAKVDVGVAPRSSLDELVLQYQKDTARYQQLMAERETMERDRQASPTLNQQTLQSIQAEMKLVEQQIQSMQTKVQTGVMSPADPALLQLQRDLLALQRKADEIGAAVKK